MKEDVEAYLLMIMGQSTKVIYPCEKITDILLHGETIIEGSKFLCCAEHISILIFGGRVYCPWSEYTGFWGDFNLSKEEHGPIILRLFRERKNT